MPRTTTLLTRPPFVVDPGSINRTSGRQIDWAKVPVAYRPSGSLFKSIRAGTVTGELGGKAVPAAVTQTLSSVVVSGNVATATLVAHGYVVGDRLTIAGGSLAYANGLIVVLSVPTADTFTYAATGANATATGTITARPTALHILEAGAHEGDHSAALSGYGCMAGGLLFENLLPEATGTPAVLPAAFKAELQAAGVGTGWGFEQYADNRS